MEELQYWRVHYYIDIVAETMEEALDKAKDLGYLLRVEDIAGLRPLDESQEKREVKIVWDHKSHKLPQ